ncbi:hypothetical protein M3Y94_00987600 [Aphelenchoides besseyi]|nr:hypothetical protein M3Y94_00987600 [Aphelenchoides besseyi]
MEFAMMSVDMDYASSSSVDFPIPTKLLDAEGGCCVICGRANFGKHYGVAACLGRKSFFRRAIIQGRRYVCDNNFQCGPERRSRGPCPACRLNRCFLAGMNKSALHGKRDIIQPRRGSSKSSLGRRSASSSSATSSLDAISPEPRLIDDHLPPPPTLVHAITKIDQMLRARKLDRFRSQSEARKLSCNISGKTVEPFYYFTGLRIVDTVELAALTSMDMWSMVEWASTLRLFNKLTLAHRAATLRRFSVYQLTIETGYSTAISGLNDVWMMQNGTTCMPRTVDCLNEDSQKIVTPARKWRQERLYARMTNNAIDDVALPMRRLGILPEELAVLKIIVLCQVAAFVHVDETSVDGASRLVDEYKNEVIEDLFRFYRHAQMKDYEERFGNLLLLISGIVNTATPLEESFQVMRLFQIVPFDRFTERLLFSSEPPLSI